MIFLWKNSNKREKIYHFNELNKIISTQRSDLIQIHVFRRLFKLEYEFGYRR